MSPPEGLWTTSSPGQSRPPSTLALGDEDGNATSQANKEQRLRLEQERASMRDKCLMQSLTELNVFSASMTKRLDERYYAVLEKMSMLQNTVAAMKVLAETSRNICDSFDKDTKELHGEIVEQLRAVSCLDPQEARISELLNRIHQDRSRIKALTDRIDIVRERVEGWERADRAWQENTRRRLKIIWSITSVATILVIALAVSVNGGRVATHAPGSGSLGRPLGGWLNSSFNGSQNGSQAQESGTGDGLSCTLRRDDDERLRAFDEL
ncbi:hypothetical protein CDD82_3311 [Ophiocordyceps australis]|uniref:Uncharacterized protein n=1 Tax=Ophiocordyceps australis TaxID=1399860 RepID=A0A2C5ZA27_9HYPO|nr:hypothetical protein CDD82_3311 [Ophiocordyceps australis]